MPGRRPVAGPVRPSPRSTAARTRSGSLIASPLPGSQVCEILSAALEIVRLGQGVDATGEFHPGRSPPYVRGSSRSTRSRSTTPACRRSGCTFVATSAVPDAKNRDEFFAGMQAAPGRRPPDVISGESGGPAVLPSAPSAECPGWRAGSGHGHRRRLYRTDHRRRHRRAADRRYRLTSDLSDHRTVLQADPVAVDDLGGPRRGWIPSWQAAE